MKTVILLVSPDDLLSQALAEQICDHDGFELLRTKTMQDISVQDKAYHLVLFDGRCEPDSLQSFKGRPVIALLTQEETGQTSQMTAPYLIKPFRITRLIHHIHALLKKESEKENFRLGAYLFEPSEKRLKKGRKTIYLTGKETDILTYLCRLRPETVSREALLKDVWGYHPDLDTHTLETHIYRLRQKLQTQKGTSSLLITDAGGYRLEG